jgi:parallel beta-helix repeat protein
MKATIILAALIVATLSFTGCQKDLVQSPNKQHQTEVAQYFEPSQDYLYSFDKLIDRSSLATRSSCQWNEIPAGSTNALAQAVNDACSGGVIYLKSGIHTETQTIIITKPVIIIGEAGSVLKVQSVLKPLDPITKKFTLSPALHVLNAPNTAFLDLDIQPIAGDGATAILFENSGQSAVIRTKLTNFQFGIFLEKSDRMVVLNNNIKGSIAWKTNPNAQVMGLCLSSSQSSYVAGNELSNSLFGAFLSDKWGTAVNNNAHDNRVGIQLCGLRPDYLLPSGQISGADASATGWKTNSNVSSTNLYAGYVIIASSHWNLLDNNTGSGNGSYDMDLVGDTNRPGFFAAASYDNTVTAPQSQRIKDCGIGNKVIGGTMININTDPCK